MGHRLEALGVGEPRRQVAIPTSENSGLDLAGVRTPPSVTQASPA